MELRQVAYNVIQNNKEFFEENRISPTHLVMLYKVYYDSLVNEIFSPNKNKYYMYQNELGVFKNNLSGYVAFIKQWRFRLRKSELIKKENPLEIAKLFRDKVYLLIIKEVDLQITYIDEIKHYIEYDRLTYEQVMEFNNIFNWVRAIGNRIRKNSLTVRRIANSRVKYFEQIEKENSNNENLIKEI